MSRTITHADLFNAWCKHQDDPQTLALILGITAEELADLTDNPDFARRVAAWERLTRVYRDGLVFEHQRAAASQLRKTMSSDDPIEARRAATVLVRLCRNMLEIGAPAGGTALQSGAPPKAKPAPHPNVPAIAPPQSTTGNPRNVPPSPVAAPPPLPLITPLHSVKTSTPQVITKLTALAGAAPVARASSP